MDADLDIPSDLPKRRAAPLGWWFPLVFVIQAALPGLVPLVLASQVGFPWSLLMELGGAALIVGGPALLVLLAVLAYRRISALREVERHGVPADAILLDAHVGLGRSRTTEDGVRRAFKKVKLHLQIRPVISPGASGPPPIDVVGSWHFTMTEVERLVPGTTLRVRYLPHDPRRVLVEPPRPPAPPQPYPSQQQQGVRIFLS